MRYGRLLQLTLGAVCVSAGPAPHLAAQDRPVHAGAAFVSFERVEMGDPVWRPRVRDLVDKTLPHAFKNTEVAQERLRLCAEFLENGGGPLPEVHRFNTSDLYKVIEGAALMIAAEPNEQIEAEIDRIADLIARAQKGDGYLYIPHITGAFDAREMGDRPYGYVLHSHELYNVGHLYEAAVAYARATGKTKLLEIAENNAQHVNRAFFVGDPNYNGGEPVMQAPGHEEIEIALVKLYQYTGNELYLTMAKKFLDIRGVTYVPDGGGVNSPTYAQQHAPVAEQREAVGHAVRATYLYAAMAEVDSVRGEDTYTAALDGIWHNIVDTKMHVTGGLGAVHGIEGFGPSYELPNKDTYLETCAAVGNVFFNMRMFLKEEDAKYVDVAEVALYNNCLSGIGLDGTSFFYPNPLEADYGHAPRSGWFGTACCPSNLARLIPQVAGYMYAVKDDRLYCALYGANKTVVNMGATPVAIEQAGNYPFSGGITLTLTPESDAAFALCMRIPTWAGGQPVPGELYHFEDDPPAWSLKVNGERVEPRIDRGFAVVERTWRAGDTVELELPMPARLIRCSDKVSANRGRVAISRGPIVYCAEGIDNGGAVQRFYLDPAEAVENARMQKLLDDPLGDLPRLLVPAHEARPDQADAPSTLTMIPYFAWSNRDRGSMIVWLPDAHEGATPIAEDRLKPKFASVTASHTFDGDSTDALLMHNDPKHSFDRDIPRWTGWPQRGREQWVEIALHERAEITSIGVYFYDDTGGVQTPGQWHVEIPTDGGWQRLAIYNTDSYSTLKDAYNTVHPRDPLTTDRIRIVMSPKHDQTSVGLLSVDVMVKGEDTKPAQAE